MDKLFWLFYMSDFMGEVYLYAARCGLMFQYRLTGQLDLSCSRHDVSVVCLMSVRCASLLGKAANCLIVFSPCSCHSTLLSCHSDDRREEESRNLKDKGEILRFAQNDREKAKITQLCPALRICGATTEERQRTKPARYKSWRISFICFVRDEKIIM